MGILSSLFGGGSGGGGMPMGGAPEIVPSRGMGGGPGFRPSMPSPQLPIGPVPSFPGGGVPRMANSPVFPGFGGPSPGGVPGILGGGSPVPRPQGMPVGQPQQPSSPNSIPGGPATSWRPQSNGQLMTRAHQMLSQDTWDNLQQNPQFNAIVKNLEQGIFKGLPQESYAPILKNVNTLRTEIANKIIPNPQQQQGTYTANRVLPPSSSNSINDLYAGKSTLKFGETGQTSLEKYNSLQPEFQQKLYYVMKDLEAKGWKPLIRNGMRSQEQADKNAAAGTGVRNSAHLQGIAADVVDASGPNNLNATNPKFWRDLRESATKHGIRSGMDFRKQDRPHIDMRQ